jgi:hypothetical protein
MRGKTMKKQSYKKRRDEEKTKRTERQKSIDCLDVLWERIGEKKSRIKVDDIALDAIDALDMGAEALDGITALSYDIKKFDRAFLSQEARIGFNAAIALFNKHLGGI